MSKTDLSAATCTRSRPFCERGLKIRALRARLLFLALPPPPSRMSVSAPRVCGRIIAYQTGGTGVFGYHAAGRGIDSYYVYGVSVTYGAPRNHIWTLAAGMEVA